MANQIDMPLMSQIGIKVAPGTDVQIAISPTIIDTDKDAMRFNPENR